MRSAIRYVVCLLSVAGALLLSSRVSAQEAPPTDGKVLSTAPPKPPVQADLSAIEKAQRYTDAARLLAPYRDEVPNDEWKRITTGLQRLLDREAPDSDYRRSEAVRAARYFERHFGTPNRPEHAASSTPSVTQVGPVHTVPFASEGNRIELSITGNTNGPVHVSVKKAPPWLELNTQSVALSGADVAADRRAEFTFSVDRAAPATDTATVTFDLSSGDDELLARKQVRVKVQTPTGVTLQGNYPNPFRRQTTISYELPREADVRIEIYDLLG